MVEVDDKRVAVTDWLVSVWMLMRLWSLPPFVLVLVVLIVNV